MNRAILIVICDFLVSAMLTMMTGMVPGHTGGTGVGLDESTTKVLLNELNRRQQELETLRARLREAVARGATPEAEAELKKLTAELAENLSRQSKLRASLAATPENTGMLDAKRLRKRLDEEQIRRLQLEIKLGDVSGDLREREKNLQQTGEKLRVREREYAVQSRELSRTRDVLADTSRALVDSTKKNAEIRAELTGSETRRAAAESEAAHAKEALSAARRELTRTAGELSEERKRGAEVGNELARKETEVLERNRELRAVRDSLRTLNAAHTRTEGQLGALQIRFAETSGRLATREQDNASLRDELSRISREYHIAALSRQEAETKAQMMQETLKDTVRELSASRQELSKSQQTNARLDATVETMKKLAAETAAPDKNLVFERYAGAVVRLECTVSEKAFLGSRTGSLTSFYPVVEYDGRSMLVGALNRFAGDWDKVLDFRDVTLVEMAVSPPFGGPSGQIRRQLAGPMLASTRMPHLAAFPFQDKNCRPLTVLEAGRLQERGVEKLFLFKCSGFESNAALSGRVSLVMDAEKPSLFVRNAGRANNELNAEPGDIIMTSQGEFVGVVSARERIDGVDGARVPLFVAGRSVWEAALTVPLDKSADEKFYSRFASQMQKIRRTFAAGYHRR